VPFVLDPNLPVSSEIRRVTRERLGQAVDLLDGLRDADAAEVERVVHEVRKRCKEVRAVARLVRTALGDDFDRFNANVRSAADELGPIRDAHALLGTFDDLRATTGRTQDGALDLVGEAQRAAAERATESVVAADPRIERARVLLVDSRKQVKRWKVPDGHLTLVDGLDTSYRRGRRALRQVAADPTDDGVHEWRKAVKQLWYQIRLIEMSAPSALEPLAHTVDGLAEALGDDHDLAVLIERLREHPDRYGGKATVKHATRLARAQQDDLRRRAFRLAATVYAERPRAFARRMRTYWELAAAHGPELATGGIAELVGDEHHLLAPDVSISSVERERKFLLDHLPEFSDSGVGLRQGYLAIDGSVSVRVRDAGHDGCTLTVKAGRGAVRTELEWPLTRPQFDAAWDQTKGRRIHKTRHRIALDPHTVEVDVFHDDLDGLILAEVEFDSEAELAAFEPPAWFGTEVTDRDEYTNASLAVHAERGRPGPPS
jgi:CYTH domain-containing protein/CHAD domain-containing protein